jgi:glycosyltransferase involved in cell wall biosynthesis
MATVVLDLELEDLYSEITVPKHYSQAFVLVRLKGNPAGQLILPVIDGRVESEDELRKFLIDKPNWDFWKNWLHDYLQHDDEPSNSTLPKATIAVCTRDRPDDLRSCLEGLLKLPDDGQEILVIDNCPTSDATLNLVDKYSQIRYVREDRPGLNRARNRALQESTNEIVAFIDDDAIPDVNWLRGLVKNFDDPLVLCTTGLTLPAELETEAQEWFERISSFGRGFKRTIFDRTKINPSDVGLLGSGVNMALHRKILDYVGTFDEALETGTPSRSAGDADIFSRILFAGYRIVYEPSALNWHRHRQSWAELRRQLYDYGVGIFSFYTRSLLFERELGVTSVAHNWVQHQLREILKSSRRKPGNMPLDVLFAQLLGCVVGPWAYLYSRWFYK